VGELVAQTPAKMIITPEKAWASDIGQLITSVMATPQSPENDGRLKVSNKMMLWIYMASGRSSGCHQAHPWELYLNPDLHPAHNATGWLEHTLQSYLGTENPIFKDAIKAKLQLRKAFDAIRAALKRKDEQLDLPFTFENLVNAKEMYSSRAFTRSHLGSVDNAVAYADADVMIPLIDAFNHDSTLGGDVKWEWSGDPVSSVGLITPKECGVDVDRELGLASGGMGFRLVRPKEKGEQVFMSYGLKSNHELIFDFGFAVPDNRSDALVLSLSWSDNDEKLHRYKVKLLEKLHLTVHDASEVGEPVAGSCGVGRTTNGRSTTGTVPNKMSCSVGPIPVHGTDSGVHVGNFFYPNDTCGIPIQLFAAANIIARDSILGEKEEAARPMCTTKDADYLTGVLNLKLAALRKLEQVIANRDGDSRGSDPGESEIESEIEAEIESEIESEIDSGIDSDTEPLATKDFRKRSNLSPQQQVQQQKFKRQRTDQNARSTETPIQKACALYNAGQIRLVSESLSMISQLRLSM
jgi:hypothetical protein